MKTFFARRNGLDFQSSQMQFANSLFKQEFAAMRWIERSLKEFEKENEEGRVQR
jgi:hypothetical protein